MKHPRSILGLLALAALMAACNQNSTSSNDKNPVKADTSGAKDTTHTDTTHTDTTHHVDTTVARPVSLKISGTLTAIVDQTSALTLTAKDSANNVVSPGSVTWSSSDSTLISVASNGTVTPLRIGTATIRAVAGSLRDSVSFTSFLPPYTFVFPAGVSAAEQQLIRDGVQYAHAFHKTTFGRAVQESTTVSGVMSDPGCSSGGSAAFTGPRTVTFCLANQGWTAHGPIMKQKIVQHELFHVWQFEYKWISNPNTAGATWAIEGSAELMGFKGIAARNLLSFETGLGCQVKESSDFATRTPPGLPALSTVESRQAFQTTVGPLYTHSMLAMDYLTQTNGLNALKVYGDAIAAGTEWHTAFETAFGMSTTTFYAQFPAYVGGLTVPPNYLCGI